ncbi:CRP/FNR family transcriptional activator FtrB [Ochrobactrum sp. 19YEA23]|uniref:cyclic nucleotide-binding domain-containing protein n=1 Tax=Ochrobactrum sp. 19YEA23 TaxID=3039854 RepID=UPI0024788FEB|nr:CRP/FNR family transcriptional activator FtrB [Ochrobactrum sp. 19YEA23]
MQKDDIYRLKKLPLFAEIADANFDRIIRPSFVQSFPARTVLLKEDEPADFLFVVLDGLVVMSAKSDDSETVLEVLGAADVFILAAVLNDDVCLQTAQTLTSARILMVPSSLVREILNEDNGFMRAVVFETARAYRKLVKELKAHKLRSSIQRLANWIIRESLATERTDVVVLQYEKRVLAAYLGMTPENLSRSFASLSEYGVTTHASSIKIGDYNKLWQFASPSPLIDRHEPALQPRT